MDGPVPAAMRGLHRIPLLIERHNAVQRVTLL